MPAPNIQIRIVRDNANSLKDEIFTITQGAHNDWCINHKSNFSQSNSTLYLKNRSDVITYVYTLFDLLKVEDVPLRPAGCDLLPGHHDFACRYSECRRGCVV